jgi:hypothetical protein
MATFMDDDPTLILWPERRWLTAGQLWTWYEDAVANGEIADEYLYAHDLQTARRALNAAGIIILGQSS